MLPLCLFELFILLKLIYVLLVYGVFTFCGKYVIIINVFFARSYRASEREWVCADKP